MKDSFENACNNRACEALDAMQAQFERRAYGLWLESRDSFNEETESQSYFSQNDFLKEDLMHELLSEQDFDLWKTFIG